MWMNKMSCMNKNMCRLSVTPQRYSPALSSVISLLASNWDWLIINYTPFRSFFLLYGAITNVKESWMCSFSILSWFRPQATLKNTKGQSSSKSDTGCLTAPLMAGCNTHSLYNSVQMQRWHAGNKPSSFQLLSLVSLAWLSSLLSGQFLPRFPAVFLSLPTCQKVRLSFIFFPCDFNHLLIWVILGPSRWFTWLSSLTISLTT